MKASNKVSCNADLPGKTGTKNDITEHVMENLPTEDEKIQGQKGDESKNSDDMSAPLFTEATADMSMVSKNSDTEKHTLKRKKRRLGMTGPAFTKSSLSANVRDVSIDLQIPKEQNVVETCTSEGKRVSVKIYVQEVPRNVLYEKWIRMTFNVQSQNTECRSVSTQKSSKKQFVFLAKMGMKQHTEKWTKKKKPKKRNWWSINVTMKMTRVKCKMMRRKTTKWVKEMIQMKVIIQKVKEMTLEQEYGHWLQYQLSQREKKKEEKTVHCQLCSESFFYESGLRTHMDHAHVDYKANEDEILTEKISRQQNILSSIPKAEKKKRKHTKE